MRIFLPHECLRDTDEWNERIYITEAKDSPLSALRLTRAPSIIFILKVYASCNIKAKNQNPTMQVIIATCPSRRFIIRITQMILASALRFASALHVRIALNSTSRGERLNSYSPGKRANYSATSPQFRNCRLCERKWTGAARKEMADDEVVRKFQGLAEQSTR